MHCTDKKIYENRREWKYESKSYPLYYNCEKIGISSIYSQYIIGKATTSDNLLPRVYLPMTINDELYLRKKKKSMCWTCYPFKRGIKWISQTNAEYGSINMTSNEGTQEKSNSKVYENLSNHTKSIGTKIKVKLTGIETLYFDKTWLYVILNVKYYILGLS